MNFRSRYRQISLLYSLLLGFFAVSSYLHRLNRPNIYDDPIAALSEEPLIYGLFILAFLVLLVVRESWKSRIAQVVVVAGVGLVVVSVIAPEDLGGDLSVLLAAALAYRYGFLRRYAIVKIAAFLALLVTARLIGTVLSDSMSLSRVANQVLSTILAAPILYWVFEDDLMRAKREKQHLEDLQQANEPFVEFGRNVTGIVHDFKNDLGLFDTFGQYLSLTEGEPVEPKQIRLYRGYVDRLARRIERIMRVTSAGFQHDAQEADLGDLVESTVYVFQSNLEFKRVITFDLSLPEETVVAKLPPGPLISILENLIRNSCEALVERYDGDTAVSGTAVLSVALSVLDEGMSITVADNGPGLPFCDSRRNENCLYSPHFAPGTTTKESGSGIGVVSVRRNAELLGTPVHMSSRPGEGVTTVISLPRDVTLRSSGDRPSGVPARAEEPAGVDG